MLSIIHFQRNGSCILWDLTESPAPFERSLSPAWLQVPKHTPLLHAAYSTAYSCVEKKGAGFKTNLDVQIVQVGALRTEAVGDQQQFASLSAGGTVTIWAVSRELHSTATFDSDLGMRPNASVRLTKISVVLCSALSGFGTGAQTALNMHVNAVDSRDLLVGMQQGGIIRIARGAEGLRHYFLNSGPFEFNNHVSAGTSTGLVLVYNVRQNIPLAMRSFQLTQQTKITAVTQIAWSPSHAQMVYVIYDRRFLAVWNLAARIEPTLIDLFDEAKSPVQRAFCWQDARKILLITLVLESGDVMVHQLERLHESNVFLGDVFAQAA
ncbi:hypothetical protein M3Y99_01811500 [Aphelenchoides fujianensis]|nr:hypothetical protein M3Y99_01811500 [Aphelenchoides fujianensis]